MYCVPVVYLVQGEVETERGWEGRKEGRREGGGRKELWLSLLKLWNFHNFHSLSVLKMFIYFCHLPNVQYLSDYISVWLLERRSEGVTTSKASFTRCDTSGLHLRPLGLRVSPRSQSSSCPETKRISPKDGPTPAAWWRSRVRWRQIMPVAKFGFACSSLGVSRKKISKAEGWDCLETLL